MSTIIATPGSASANSFETRNEADVYWTNRPFGDAWLASGDSGDKALLQATLLLSTMISGYRQLVPAQGNIAAYYRIYPCWTGTIASQIQALPWPRIGMYNRNGIAIPSTVIPQELKDAESELAGKLLASDRTADNDIAVQGIKEISAGPVTLSFNTEVLMTKILPDIVLFTLVPSWLTPERIEPAVAACFDVFTGSGCGW